MTINSKKKENINKVSQKNRERFKEQLKLIQSQPSNSFNSEEKKKDDIVELYKKMSPKEKEAFDRELEKKQIRDNYALYLKYVYPNYIFTKFHSLLAQLCQWVVYNIEQGKKVRLCISVPPRHGKSKTITETLPSWFMGRNPDLRCIVTGYNADIAERFGNNNRQLVMEHGNELFGINISESQNNKTLWEIDKHQGGMLATGILGSLTSNGGSLIIVDDPFKNGGDADNPDLRQSVYDTFADSVVTRAEGKGNAIIVIHTRWHDDDLIGRLAKTGDWKIVNIPCVWENGIDKQLNRRTGQTLCPELGFDSEWATNTQKLLGQRKWNALYQGKPFIDGGNILRRDSLKFYNEKSLPFSFEELTLSCDLSFGGTKKGNDPYCMTLWGRNGATHYLLKIYDKRASFTETNKTIRQICGEYPQLRRKIIEKKANGQATIDLLGQEIGGFVAFDPKGKSKEDRLNAVSSYFEAGNVLFPDESVFPKIEDFVDQLLRFPNAEHDDFVDTISQYLLNYEYRYGGKIGADTRFSMFARAIRGF